MTSAAKYYWLGEIASGGMGRVDLVMRAETHFRRLCAVKRLHPELLRDDDCRAMFLDEARIAGLIEHPNVVGVYDVGEDGGGPYLMMDYVHGLSVARILRATKRALPLAVAVQIAVQAAEGLHAAHELTSVDGRRLELVHRDISPQNLLVGLDGIVRVTDFGIARAMGQSTRTSTGVLKGKLGYMSPEQLRFRPLDRRSDLFALGIVLYEMIAGAPLYPSKDGEGPRRILEEPPPDIGMVRDDLPPALVSLCFRLLAKDPERRPATAREVADELRDMLYELMLLDEEAISLADFMTTRFAAEEAAHTAKVEEALQRLDEGTLPRWPLASMPTAEVAPPEPPRRVSWVAVLAVGFGLLGVAVGVGALVVSRADAPASGRGEASALAQPPATEVAEAPPEEAPTAQAIESPVALDAGAPSPRAPQNRTRRRGRVRRRRPPASAAEPARPAFDPLAPADFGGLGGRR